MVLADWLKKRWYGLRNASHQEDRQKLLELLRDAYLDEIKDIASFSWHAEQMYYPHFRERLLRIVTEEQTHVFRVRGFLS
jgi:rubrerythrin